MAQTVEIDDKLLYPGDTIRFDFVLTGGNETLRSLAIKKVKDEIYADDRLDYQGSEIVTEVDKTGLAGGVREIEVLHVYAKVRTYRRDAHPEIQKAGIGPFAVVTIISLMTTAVIVASGAVVYRSYSVQRATTIKVEEIEKIRTDPNMTAAQKEAALQSLGETQTSTGFGTGVAAAGASVGTALIIVAVLWALSLSIGRRGGLE
jgi:ribosomal protein S28E/S33